MSHFYTPWKRQKPIGKKHSFEKKIETCTFEKKMFDRTKAPFINPFLANAPILCIPLKTPENQRFSGVFRGYEMGILAWNGLIKL